MVVMCTKFIEKAQNDLQKRVSQESEYSAMASEFLKQFKQT